MSYNALPTVLKAHRHHRKQSPQPNTARPLGGLYSSCSLSSPLLTQQDLNSSYLPLNTYPAAECNVTPQPCQLLKGNHVKCCQLRAGSWGHHDLSAGTQQAETRVLPASKKLKSTSFKCHWDLVTLHYLIASKNKQCTGDICCNSLWKKITPTHSKLEMLNLLKTQLYCFWTSPFPSAIELYERLSKVMHSAWVLIFLHFSPWILQKKQWDLTGNSMAHFFFCGKEKVSRYKQSEWQEGLVSRPLGSEVILHLLCVTCNRMHKAPLQKTEARLK